MSDDSFQTLNLKVDQLIDLCAEMKRENQALKAHESSWHNEREQLLAKNKEARSRLESVLTRLKAMDPTT